MARRSQVLDPRLVAAAMRKMKADERGRLIDGMRALVRAAKREPNAARDELEDKALAYMARMPAWKGHPRVITRAKGGGAS